MDLFQSIFLGLVQGITEFLPISSSAHLVITAKLFNIEPNITYDVLLHIATLIAVCVYFYKDIIGMAKAVLLERRPESDNFRLAMFVIIGSIPTAIIGFMFKDTFESMFSQPTYVGMFLMLTAVLIFAAEKFSKPTKTVGGMTWVSAFVIGIAQGCAIAPGLSRSGSTVSTSLLLGLERPLAARFSFLLSIPAILGASAIKANDLLHGTNMNMLIGAFISAVIAYICIWAFMKLIQRTSIKPFAWYCLVVGILTITFLR